MLHVDAVQFGYVKELFLGGIRGLPRDYSPAVPESSNWPDLYSAMQCGGFVVPDHLDELSALRAAFEAERRNRSLYYTIGLTMACNFDCPYCFEEHRPDHMDRTTARRVHEFIVGKARDAAAESVFINWFGGEPLLNFDTLTYLSSHLRASCDALSTVYKSCVITNGVLLTAPRARQLVDAGVVRAQVTLDGPKQIHDGRRYYKGGQPSFDRIIQNLQDVHKIISVVLRVNVDTQNRPYLPELLGVLERAGLFDHPSPVTLYASPVVPYTEQAQMLWEPLTQTDLPSLGNDVERDLKRLGHPNLAESTFSLLEANRGGCSAMQHNSFVIGPKGDLFKCELGIHDEREAVGTVKPAKNERSRYHLPLFDKKTGSKALDWDSYNPFDNELCQTCQFVPICKGGCPKRVLERSEEFMQATCEHWDQNFAALVQHAYMNATQGRS